MEFICNKCGNTYKDNEPVYRCQCGGCLFLNEKHHITKKTIKHDRFNMWRYDEAYPLKYEDLHATFNEGLTPLVKAPVSEVNLRIKMDSLMPTGSFKDRGTVMVINYLLKKGASRITEDSSGNAGASVAAYCALGNIDCDIYIPEDTSFAKTVQIKSYGANIHKIKGTREDVALAAQKDVTVYAGHNWHPMFVEGTKSLAYELWEQNKFEAPENIVAVAGNGSTILGIYYGFKSLYEDGQVTRMPRLFAVQAENCNPIYRLFNNIKPDSKKNTTIAEGIALRNPNKAENVVQAVRKTNGDILSISDDKTVDALQDLATKGFFAEPTSSVAYAGIKELIERNVLNKESDVIMVVSGNGLKAGKEIAELIV